MAAHLLPGTALQVRAMRLEAWGRWLRMRAEHMQRRQPHWGLGYLMRRG